MSLLRIPKGSKPVLDAPKVCRARCMLTISMLLSELSLADNAGTGRLRECRNESRGQTSWDAKKKFLTDRCYCSKEVDGLIGWLSPGRMFGVGRLCRNRGESLATD